MDKKHLFTAIKSYVFIVMGLAIFALGWTAFLIPMKLTGGGVSGIAAILFFATKLPIGITTFAINLVLLAFAWKILGPRFCISTLISTAILSLFLSLGQQIFTEPLVDDMAMCTFIGAALAAFGVGLAINYGGNTGGTDIIAMMIGKYRNISYGRVTLYSNILIIGSSWFVIDSINNLVYSMVVMFFYIFISDLVIDGYKQTFQFFVFSDKNQEIADRINKDLGRGASFLKGYGSYTKEDKDILLILSHRNDKAHIIRIIKEIDSSAFISISKTSSVFGKNFDKIKI
ncbi:MAG: YitT family protein [Bacteroidales bacterium]|jgi:uncharacterized membrane-anchored protein YitT (DUF2179 family)|nr:YitT family protein [Bacteroidales bacterium]